VNVWVPQDHSLALFERWLGLKIPTAHFKWEAVYLKEKRKIESRKR
jgi:hypothetical protein